MGVPFRSQLAGLCTLAVSLTAHAEAPAPSATEPLPDAAKPALPALPKLPPVPKKPTLADVPASSLPARPELPKLPQLPSSHDLTSAGEVALAALPDEIKPLIPDPDKLAEWFQGHGGAILGTGTMVLAPLGYVAGGGKNAFYRSHLPGLGLHGQIGLLFLRRYGIALHGGYAEHLKGSDAAKAGTSWQMGLGALFLLRPEEKTPYLELGINRNSFSNDVNVLGGSATRKAAAWDGRVGLGYMVLTKSQKFLYTPWVALDFGRFSKVTQTLNGSDQTLALADDQRAWHYILSAGITFAYHKKVPALMGPPPSERPDDRDGDLVLDPHDQCPTEKEDYYPPDPNDGCPSDDWDGDKIPNAQDKCPTIAEDGLGPDPKDGCPTTDRDQDGIEDSKDACKTLREDGLGDKPTDGCPNSDRDGDGVLDADDRCPDQPETRNGFQDEDGCPDEAPRVALTEKALTIRDKLFFETGKSEIGAVSLGTIDEIAKVLAATPAVELIEIQGHADNMGAPDRNVQITQARASAVRRALIERGVAPTRLTAVGYGEYCPVAANLPERGGNEQNRRVEFRILRMASGPTGAETACAEAIRKGIHGTDPKSQGPAK
ncbi:MAG TPA: OmpA family protein [Polyangiaceae bacterium]|jgi:outer membrane protein OmpA-like peptidoglycan-associated protein